MIARHRQQYLLYLIQRIVDTTTLDIPEEDIQDIQKILFQLRKATFHKSHALTEARLELLDLVYDKLDDDILKSANVITQELIKDGIFSPADSFSNSCHKVGTALKRLDTLYQVATGIRVKRINDTSHTERMFIRRPEPGTVMDLDFWNEKLKLIGRPSIRVIRPAYPPLEEQCPYVKRRDINKIEPTPPPTPTPNITKRYKMRPGGGK